jgi:D-arabinose 1-dehydrogenase-like Zn-dependent alcohol dehydrogenase
MKVRCLQTIGQGKFEEVEYIKPEPGNYEIEVKAVMTGVCRSDIAMMNGDFGPLPLDMQGHEGLGVVTKVGKNIGTTQIGDFVATRGEPAYADYYNVRANEYVVIPEAHPRYIIEPVACGLNIINQSKHLIDEKPVGSRILILGSGFLAWVAYTKLVVNNTQEFKIDVVGNSNKDLWGDKLIAKPEGEYDVIIDLSNSKYVFDSPILKNEALIIMGTQKKIITDFGNLLWKACTMVFPSPRTKHFHSSMVEGVDMIQQGLLDVDKFWTKGYNRDTQWKQAFLDGVIRPNNYSRGYITW